MKVNQQNPNSLKDLVLRSGLLVLLNKSTIRHQILNPSLLAIELELLSFTKCDVNMFLCLHFKNKPKTGVQMVLCAVPALP